MGAYYIPSANEIALVRQHSKNIYLKVELLNHDMSIQDTLEGNIVSDTMNISSESKHRRTYSCNLVVTNSSFLVGADKKIWIDKRIRVYYGIENNHTHDIFWWLIGTFTYVNVSWSYSGTTNSLSLSLSDMMADYDGTKNGQIAVDRNPDFTTIETYNSTAGYTFKIPAGTKIKEAIIALLNNAGIKQYQVEDYPSGRDVIPYDLEYTDSLTYCDVWTDICNLYPGWEFFFDVDGTFIWRQIPTGGSGEDNERVMMDNSLIDSLYVDESTSYNFSGIYNRTEVWGKSLELSSEDCYANTSTYDASTNTYTINLDLIPKSSVYSDSSKWNQIDSFFSDLDKIGIMIKTTNVASGAKVIITGNVIGTDNKVMGTATLPAMQIVNDDQTPVEAKKFIENSIYMFTYRISYGDKLSNVLYLNGQTQCFGYYEETDPDCPFSTTSLGYTITKRSNYDKLWSDDLCRNQAEYDTYKTTQMEETISLNMIIVPWIDVSQKVKYLNQQTEHREERLAEYDNIPQYIIKSISWSTFEGTMNITMYRYRDSLEYVRYKK